MTTGIASGEANKILGAFTGGADYVAPAAFYVQLHTGDPGAAGTANVATETTRVAATFSAASGGAITNSADIDWTSVAATETYSHVSFWSASTAGTFLGSDDLAAPKAVDAGDDFSIPAGDLDITLGTVAA